MMWPFQQNINPWWRHQMEPFSALLALCAGNSPVSGEFPAQRPVTRSFDVSFDLRLNKQLSKQSWGWWFETLWRSLWRHRNAKSWIAEETLAWPCKIIRHLQVQCWPGSGSVWSLSQAFNTLRLRQNGCHFTDIFKCILLNEKAWILLKISLKFVAKVQINNIPAWVQIMAWHWPGTSHYLNQWWLQYWWIYASLGLNELTVEVVNCMLTFQLVKYSFVHSSLC